MIVRFPFLADSRKTIKFPFYADTMPQWEYLDPDDIAMMIRAHDDLEVWPTIYALPDEIGMIISAENSVEIKDISVSVDVYESAMKLVCNKLETSIATSILDDGDGNLAMVIKADETEPNILIDAARTALFKAWLKLANSNDIEFSQEVEPLLEECDTYIRAQSNLEVGPISTNLERLNALMKLADSRYYPVIGELDPLTIGLLDLMNLDGMERLVDLHLEIGALRDGDGNIRL